MPWDAASFASKHNHALRGAAAEHAARMANAILRSGAPERVAIATASKFGDKLEHRHAAGGEIKPIPSEPLQSAMHLVNQHHKLKLDEGGEVAGGDIPWFARAEARGATSGFTAGFGAGRNDKNSMALGAGSYVLPADVVAGLGEGNSLGGARIWDEILHSLPYGIEGSVQHHGSGPPRPPPASFMPPGQVPSIRPAPISPVIARGGEIKDGKEEQPVDVITADGEIIVNPRDVARFGARYSPKHQHHKYDDMLKRGADVLDSFVKEIRGRVIRHLASLPGPRGSDKPAVGHN